MKKNSELTYKQEIDNEIRQQAVKLQAVKLQDRCVALFALPLRVYAKILEDNSTRKRPYRVSFERVQRVIKAMPEFE